MATNETHVVTGAFGYSGKYITRRLLDLGHQVRTLTNSPNRPDPFGGRVDAYPLCFDDPAALTDALRGATVLYNTYWVRFNHKSFNHADAVENTRTLFRAAKDAGIERVVHVSIANPSQDSPLEYYRGKASLERSLIESGLSHAILRPTVLFGKEDILVNNIAWSLRWFPVVPMFGNGQYRLRPIHVDDLARLAVEQGKSRENVIVDAVGPESFTYRELLKTIAAILGRRRLIVGAPPRVVYFFGTILGWLVGDVMITWPEVQGLMADLLYVDSPAAGETKLTDWAKKHAGQLGRRYASELARRTDRTKDYGQP